MKKIYVIGIGAGDPSDLTLRAIEAMRAVDVFFFMDKDGAGKENLIAFRQEVLARAVPEASYRSIHATSPERPKDGRDYEKGIDWWRSERRRIFREMLSELGPEETGGFLIIGDPALYDGTTQILHELAAEGFEIDFEVVTGITSLQTLAARHRIPLNRIGEEITVTTARLLADTEPAKISNTLVMLDGRATFLRFKESDLHIYWGAYLGMEEEILIAGPLKEKADEIAETIETSRSRHGWIMDAYLLRRP
ncbi:precorrin-6A synthase [Rhodopseudomonas julia]|uniref:Precorrin-6A synthase [deacetylating] n=1 Tax=Rhodopseudomonas julia TaxID=200617 RepID=A0ABU0C2M6_9BRAD|nr:precorrin-6A synthase (deacetylating) [Rhodopseudomonas julia]MDQ0324171.1 precorrin-6A synthase [Rhodopseudomonas julia]